MSNLRDENQKILTSFEAQGTDLKRSYEFDFRVSLKDKDACKEFLRELRSNHNVPKGTVFMIISDPEDYQVSLSLLMKPSVDAISDIEETLLFASKGFDAAKVHWEFKVG